MAPNLKNISGNRKKVFEKINSAKALFFVFNKSSGLIGKSERRSMPDHFSSPKALKARLPLIITIIEIETLTLSKENSAAVKRIA